QGLEGAAAPFVGVLGLEHVKAQLPPARHVALGGDKLKASLGVDEPLDQPGARDPVHEDPAPHDPGASPPPGPRLHRRARARPLPPRARAASRPTARSAADRPGVPKKSIAAISA